jgi:Uncharacterized protein conserved in bacteria (DUF2325)
MLRASPLKRCIDEENFMRIGWIGGRERNETQLERIAERSGHSLEFHSGHVGGRGADGIRTLVERSDFVVIVTDVNSHGAVLLAKKIAQQLGRPSLVIRRCGSSRFQALIEALEVRDAQLLAATA